MAVGLGIRAPKGGPKSVAQPTDRPSFVLGSRPGYLRAPPVPRVKPAAASTTQYGKAGQANPAGASFGNTGLTDQR